MLLQDLFYDPELLRLQAVLLSFKTNLVYIFIYLVTVGELVFLKQKIIQEPKSTTQKKKALFRSLMKTTYHTCNVQNRHEQSGNILSVQ